MQKAIKAALQEKLTAFLETNTGQLIELGYWPPRETKMEVISDIFCKWHLGEVRPGQWPALHYFSGPDPSPAHDHPWDFTSFILKGGYVEKVYTRRGDGTFASELIHRREGTCHHLAATHIHQLVELPEGECWTLVLAGPRRRKWRSYRKLRK